MERKNRKFETVFASSDDWQSNACLNWSHDPIDLYAVGYKEAGDILSEYVIKRACNQDTLIYPIVYLYRHYIELRLKEIICEGRILIGKGDSYPKRHEIDDLWNVAKQIVTKVFEYDNDPPSLDYAEHVIQEFSNIDQGSFSFRYPTSKNGEKNLKGIIHINIRRLAEHVNELAKDLDGISLGISVYREGKQEML